MPLGLPQAVNPQKPGRLDTGSGPGYSAEAGAGAPMTIDKASGGSKQRSVERKGASVADVELDDWFITLS